MISRARDLKGGGRGSPVSSADSASRTLTPLLKVPKMDCATGERDNQSAVKA